MHSELWVQMKNIDERCLGCGRFFEGTPAEMHTALNKTLSALPNDTKVYVSIHESESQWLGC